MDRSGWIWYFAGLFVLGALAVVTPWVFNLRQQLQPEVLAECRALWRQRGPRDYDLEYGERIDVDPRRDEFQVEVRGGKVTAARCNGQPTTEPVWTIDAMFDHIEKNLQGDRDAGQRHYTVAVFDATDGHPLRYVRRVRGSHDRLEWRVRVRPVTD